MVMTLTTEPDGRVRIEQRLERPLVYLDHWAICQLADSEALADRFVGALHASQGTWVFSQVNSSEFIASRDVDRARRVEQVIQRAFPHFHVIDTLELGIFNPNDPNRPRDPDAPDKDWLLIELADRAALNGGRFNTHRFISDAIAHADRLLPVFEHMKLAVATGVAQRREQLFTERGRKNLVPRPNMKLQDILIGELLIEPEAPHEQRFRENDSVDFMHAIPACLMCDAVLLDSAWCHKVRVASRRIAKAGIKGHIARCYSPKLIGEFLADFDAMAKWKMAAR